MPFGIVRKIASFLALLVTVLLVSHAVAETFRLNNGETLEGELLVTSANDSGVQIKVGDGKYERIPWSNFAQEDLKKFRENRKLEPLVEPFIEVSIEEKVQRTEVPIKQPERLDRPPKQSLISAMFGSGLGLFVLLLLYAANLYAGFEIAVFRAQSLPLVLGVSAVLPIIGPIIFLSMKTNLSKSDLAEESAEAAAAMPAPAGTVAAAEQAAAAAAKTAPPHDELNPMRDDSAPHPTSLHLAHHEAPKASIPQTQVYQRGQFTFNRRFIETKFSGFFGVVRRDADKDLQLIVKSARGTYVATRISRIAANDMHLDVHHGAASQEVTVNFQEIQEIQVKHKDAK